MGKASWKISSLSEVADLLGGGTPRRSEASNFGDYINWVTPSDLPPVGEVRLLGKVKEGLSEKGLSGSSAKMIPSGSVLFSSRASIGKIAVVDRDCCTNQGFVSFIPRKNKVDPWFLAFSLRYHTNDILKLAGETTYKEISRKKLNEFSIQIPPLKEQQRIVARIKELLDRADEIHFLHTQSIEEIAALQSSLLLEVESHFNGAYAPIGDVILRSRNGRSIRASNGNPNGRVLTLSAVRDVSLDLNKYKQVLMDDNVAEKYSFKAGDVFVSRANTRNLVGLSSVAFSDSKRNMIYPDLLIKLDVNPKIILPQFLAYALRFPNSREQICSKATGTSQSMVKISGASLKKVEIPLPSKEIQKTTVEMLSGYDQICRSLKRNIQNSKTEQLKKSILEKAFSGEL